MKPSTFNVLAVSMVRSSAWYHSAAIFFWLASWSSLVRYFVSWRLAVSYHSHNRFFTEKLMLSIFEIVRSGNWFFRFPEEKFFWRQLNSFNCWVFWGAKNCMSFLQFSRTFWITDGDEIFTSIELRLSDSSHRSQMHQIFSNSLYDNSIFYWQHWHNIHSLFFESCVAAHFNVWHRCPDLSKS